MVDGTDFCAQDTPDRRQSMSQVSRAVTQWDINGVIDAGQAAELAMTKPARVS